ncbi:hypothetical protein ACQUFY_26310 (plasmid) [Robbsia andropogonis]|uniref:hypothetical protein n=1 Tax=Robbsia andropogonis TaxID=28092 RepID=UPI003D1E07D4
MRWTVKKIAIWIAAFIVTSFGTLVFHGTLGSLFSFVQCGLALIVGWPVLKAVIGFFPAMADAAEEERRSKSVYEQNLNQTHKNR